MEAPPPVDPTLEVEPWRPDAAGGEEREIVQLPEEVVNKIAAGEVVQRPANATKELIENSLDAGATRVDVTATGGGMGVLRIEDNGHGIGAKDYPLLCTRFATSKLTQFDDLLNIATYGFRGEALASLSMVCRVEVTSRKRGQGETHLGKFREGVMKDTRRVPAGMAGCGTVIKATDMFYSMPQRREMLSKPAEEYRHIVDVLTKYAVQYPHCHFTCRKAVAAAPDLSAAPADDRTAAIRQLYGKALADGLLPVTVVSEELDFKASVLMSPLSFFNGKFEFTLFINGRLVNHDGLARMVKALYAEKLPKKAHPYVFIELRLNPKNVDVNAHPTKEKVIFLAEDDVVAAVEAEMRPVLERSLESSGNLHLKRKLSEMEGGFGVASQSSAAKKPEAGAAAPRGENSAGGKKEYEHNLVRTDHALGQGALDKFFMKARTGDGEGALQRCDTLVVSEAAAAGHSRAAAGGGEAERVPWASDPNRLTSVARLLEETWASHDPELRKALSRAVYVGWANQRQSLVQLELELYVVDLCVMSAELFYQKCLQNIGNPALNRIVLGQAGGLDVAALLRLVAPALPDASVGYAVGCLTEHAALLAAYFGVELEGAGGASGLRLTALPLLLRGATPPVRKLPLFLYRLATAVRWDAETACLRDVATEIADLYMLDDGVVLPDGGAPLSPAAAPPPSAADAPTPPQAAAPPPAKTAPAAAKIAVPSTLADDEDEDEDEAGAVPTDFRAVLAAKAPRPQHAAVPDLDSDGEDDGGAGEEEMFCMPVAPVQTPAWVAQHCLLPAIRTSLLPPKRWRSDRALRRVADLHTMYKIFERC